MKIFIVTYRRPAILNKTLDILFNKTDFSSIPNTEVNIINNHSEFVLNEEFKDKVHVFHNNTRPDWDTGNLARNWNEALLHGFKRRYHMSDQLGVDEHALDLGRLIGAAHPALDPGVAAPTGADPHKMGR